MNGNIGKTQAGHVVAATVSAWGHAKAACALLAKIVRGRKVYATLILPLPLRDKAVKEFARQFVPDVEDELRSRIRIVFIECDPSPLHAELLNQNAVETYKKIVKGGSIEEIPGSGKLVEDVGPPQLFILDFFMYPTLLEVRKLTGHSIPVYALQSGAAAPVLYLFGPEHLGGKGDLIDKFKPVMHLDEKSRSDEAMKIFTHIEHKVTTLPGLPPMYDYEHHPQEMVFEDSSAAFLIASNYRFFSECDGMIMNNTSLEGPAINSFKSWIGEDRVICPAPFDFELKEQITDRSPEAVKIIQFLDKMLQKHGEKSVVYISFGSIWWSTEPEKIWATLDVLIELNTPFIFSHASPFGAVPQDVLDKLNVCDFAYESTWIPQTEVLKHKACGWFVSHCGHNSISESLSAGVPLICWPFDADQPCNAANIAFTHNMGYELFEVRNGHGLLPIHRLGNRVVAGTVEAVKNEVREVLTKAKGEDGRLKRENVRKFRESLVECWKSGGESWKEIKKITDMLAGDK